MGGKGWVRMKNLPKKKKRNPCAYLYLILALTLNSILRVFLIKILEAE